MSDPEKSDLPKDSVTLSGRSLTSTEVNNNDPPTVVKSNATIVTSSSGTDSGATRLELSDASRSEQMPVAGVRIGNYELGPPIGVGGMATVYAAQDLSLERMVALKILPPKTSQDSEVLQRFLLEGKAAAQLDHPNIARIHALGHDGIYYYLAFEYVEGRTVRQWIDDRGQLDIELVLDWSSQVAEALAHADHRGVVHRDIKPSNLIVTPGGQVKLVDLGLARRYETQGHVDLTQTGVTLGTFDYISPEQARDPRNVDIRSDLYSLGCTIFHMLAGVPPFPGQNVVQKLLQHQEQSPPDLSQFNPKVSPEISAFVTRLMAKSPADRPSSAEICSKELKELIQSRKSTEPIANPAPEFEPTSLRGIRLWLAPALVMASLVTLVSWMAGDDPAPNPAPANSTETLTKQGFTKQVDKRDSPELTATIPIAPVMKPRQSAPANFRVADGPSLAKALNEANPGSVITLTSAGPYRLNPGDVKPIIRSDLTIKSDQDILPVIVPDGNQPEEKAARDSILLRFSDSRILLQGMVFDIRGDSGNWLDAAISAEECDLVMRDVRILADQTPDKDSTAFVRLRVNDARAEKLAWRPVRIENCRFLGPRVAINADGPVDLSISDTAHLSSEPLIWVDSGDKETPWPCLIQLDHVSVMATGWTPILELNSAAARIRAQDCIFAPRPGGQISLLSSRRPSRIDWFGRGNIFGEVTTFMESTRFNEEILDFDSWTKSDSTIREQGSQSTKQSVYSPSDSSLLAAKGRWADAFSLNRGPWSNLSAGVRGWAEPKLIARLDEPELLANASPVQNSTSATLKPVEKSASVKTPEKPITKPAVTGAIDQPELVATAPPPMPMPMPMPMQVEGRSEDGTEEVANRVVPQPSQAAEGLTKSLTDEALIANNTRTGLTDQKSAITKGTSGSARSVTFENNDSTALVREVVETSEFQDAIRKNLAQGASISLASGGQINLTNVMRMKSGKWVFSAEPGAVRPRLIFKSQNPSQMQGMARWAIDSGVTVRLRGLDIEWDANEPAQERLFEVMSGGQLVFEDCTLTVRGSRTDLTVFAMTGPNSTNFEEATSPRATVRLIDSLVRTSGGLFRSPGNVRNEFELTGTLAVIGRSLLTIQAPGRLETSQTTRLQMTQTTAILGTNLATIFQGRGPGEPPHLECKLQRTILAGDPSRESPLLEVRDGDPNHLDKDCITWEGDEVGYHQWETYRLDQNDLSGMLARRQNREEWQLTRAAQDTQALHGDLGFTRNFRSAQRPIWELQPSDFAIQTEGIGQGLGARLERLPRVIPLANLKSSTGDGLSPEE